MADSAKFRFHHLAIPHTVTHPDYTACAYTQKVLKFSKMMTQRGHAVIHYGHEDSQVVCSEHVTVTDREAHATAYGNHDWRKHFFRHSTDDHASAVFNARAIPELRERIQPGDFLLCNWGHGHRIIADALADTGVIVVEPGIGYDRGVFAPFRAYESHTIRTVCEPFLNQNWYNRVIPNYFDEADFEYREDKQPWVLFLGRVSEAKGISAVIEATRRAGVELKVAGQGLLPPGDHPHVQHLGYADAELRQGLMARASALIIASTYLEPFGGVQVEAMLSGTPVISPFYGAFAEVNIHGKTGYHCHTLRDYVDAIHRRSEIDPAACRATGLNYTLNNIAPQFEQWFSDIHTVYNGAGWYE